MCVPNCEILPFWLFENRWKLAVFILSTNSCWFPRFASTVDGKSCSCEFGPRCGNVICIFICILGSRLVPRSQNDPGSWIRKIQDLCILKILDPIATFCRKILRILDPIETFCRKILKILDSIETFCRKTLNTLDPTATFCRQILKILDPAQTLLRWFLEILDLGQTICRGIFNILDSWTMYPIDLRPHGWTPFHYVQQHSLSLISWFSWS